MMLFHCSPSSPVLAFRNFSVLGEKLASGLAALFLLAGVQRAPAVQGWPISAASLLASGVLPWV
ncbi:hypothetical protein JD974_22895 [Chromobacterium haemolyticum]|uniref:Uncharacterized protein n=1 Tax=Chromobacterium haemolyticum TaxID=394935 RepID=A0ABS3GVW5_9NEIS|nr:hypothetical protein [Chromobacterium haemolyticum]MBK0417261.1 hypothetical protein [Chromobacterium haemolyticum]MBO0418403.1 hypothetical protein [Chromobacterium haemolyticum]MBO0501712.1 hypothetical protein [Chromobacterium haemolyticum]